MFFLGRDSRSSTFLHKAKNSKFMCVSLKKSKIGFLNPKESERIRKRILRFFTKQINPRSLGSWCIKGTEESTLGVDSSAPLRHRDPKDLGLIC